MCRFSDLRCKEVVCLFDGSRLGYVDDLSFDDVSGNITALIIFGKPRFFGLLGRGEDTVIPWCEIRKIGADTVLVEQKVRPSPSQNRKNGFFASLFK